MNDYVTRDFNECVWLTLSGVGSTDVVTEGNGVYFHFPDLDACRQLIASTDFTRYENTIREVKSIIRNAKP